VHRLQIRPIVHNPCKFQPVSRLGRLALLRGTILVVGVSQTAALNRGRHIYSTGRPSRWALAHILVPCGFFLILLSSFFLRHNLSGRRLHVYHRPTRCGPVRIWDSGLKPAARGWMKIHDAKMMQKSPSAHHRTTLSGYIFATKG